MVSMEALYSRLYDKYTRLKAKKDSEIEKLNYDQEEKFITYVSAADELIGYLTSEKERLVAEISDLRQEVALIRSAKDEEQEKYEKKLMEENQKNRELSEEIEKLHGKQYNSSDMFAIKQVSGSPVSSRGTNNSTLRKRPRNHMHEKDVEVALGSNGQHVQNRQNNENERILPGESDNALDKENMFSNVFNNANQPKCCRRRLGGPENASDSSSCVFQELVECLLDLKFSISTQTDDNIQITAVHELSGYSFNLGWVKNMAGEEELLYRVSSLGTFERVAPEWMRDVMLFSKSMCRNFFKTVSCIVKPHD